MNGNKFEHIDLRLNMDGNDPAGTPQSMGTRPRVSSSLRYWCRCCILSVLILATWVYIGCSLYLNTHKSLFVCILGPFVTFYLVNRLNEGKRARCTRASQRRYLQRPLKPRAIVALWIRRISTISVVIGIAVFLAIDIRNEWRKSIPLGGLIVLVILSVVGSKNPSKINWTTVIWGIILQFSFGLLILRWKPGFSVCQWLGRQVTTLLSYTDIGSEFVFGEKYIDHPVVFKIYSQLDTTMQSELTEDESEWGDLLSLRIFHEAVCLISTNRDLSLKVEEDALRELEAIDKEVNVIAITGLYRTGKSVLLNQLLAAQRDTPVFGVGHTTAAMTRGIWATCVRHPYQPDQVLMLLDTEGLGDIKKGNRDHDNRIFTIATLLSSTLIYNIMGPFNEDALRKLLFIARISDGVELSRKPTNEDKMIDSGFPTFVLCLRDFYLKMQNPDEEEMSPKEYLEDCLQQKYSGKKSDDEKFNKLRDAIKKYFHRRYCFSFERPTKDQEDLEKLDSASCVKFTDRFTEDLQKMTDFIYKCKSKPMLNGSKTTGKGLASLARTYVQSIRDGAIPSVGDAMMHVANVRNQKLKENGIKSFTEKTKQLSLPEPNYPVLDSMLKQYHDEEVHTFKEEIIFDENDQTLNELKTELDKLKQTVARRNKSLLLEKCMGELEKLHGPISKDVDRGMFAHNDGETAYRHAVLNRNQRFREFPDEYGDQKEIAITRFHKMKEAEMRKVRADAVSGKEKSKQEVQMKTLQDELNQMKVESDSTKFQMNAVQEELRLRTAQTNGEYPRFYYFLTFFVCATALGLCWIIKW